MAELDVESILSKLTVPEQISLLSGSDFWHTISIPKHGIPALRLSDGPNGIRGTQMFNNTPAACFPCGTALGATWDAPLLHRAGILMGREAIAKGVHVLLGPCINMQRSPLGGRGFESLSEDPVLAGLGAAALTNGIQKTGVVAAIKHFVCNDQEHRRNIYDALVTPRALREIYLLPFQLAVRDSKPGSFMSAYNRVNGAHMSENEEILNGILRGEWGWEGLVLSDWFGVYSTTESIKAGLDLEMPGPTKFRGPMLQHALISGKVSYLELKNRAREVLKLINRCHESGISERAKEGLNNTPETSQLLRKLANDSIVMLKNEKNTLPLKKNKSTLVVGPNAKSSTYCGGGSSFMIPYYAVTPLDGISSKLCNNQVRYALGCTAYKELPVLGHQIKTPSGEPGATFKVFQNKSGSGFRELMDEIVLSRTTMLLLNTYSTPLKSPPRYATLECILTAESTGTFQLGLCVYGTAKLYVNGRLVVDNETKQVRGSSFYGKGTREEKGLLKVEEGKAYLFQVELASVAAEEPSFGGFGFRLGGAMLLDPMEEISHAVNLAKEVDQVIICAGLNADWETEGADRPNMKLPAHTDLLISSVSAVNPNTVVILQAGSPVEMPWLPSVPSVLQAWYGGNECGNSIADTVFGDSNPSAKLPVTFPHRAEDNPTFLNYRSERGRTLYGEDIYIGYRYYEAVNKSVLFPFGHGLSYTSFTFSELQISIKADMLFVCLVVSNTGKVSGAQVAQVYISQTTPSILRPIKELKGFQKVFLKAGERQMVVVEIPLKYAVSFWDEARGSWIMEKDTYRVTVGDTSATSEANSIECSFQIGETSWWNGI